MLCLMVSLELQFEVMPQRPSLESRLPLVITRDNVITISFLVMTLGDPGEQEGQGGSSPSKLDLSESQRRDSPFCGRCLSLRLLTAEKVTPRGGSLWGAPHPSLPLQPVPQGGIFTEGSNDPRRGTVAPRSADVRAGGRVGDLLRDVGQDQRQRLHRRSKKMLRTKCIYSPVFKTHPRLLPLVCMSLGASSRSAFGTLL